MSDNTAASAPDDPSAAATTPPGPTDQGRTGGMATREVAPDVVEKHRDESGH